MILENASKGDAWWLRVLVAYAQIHFAIRRVKNYPLSGSAARIRIAGLVSSGLVAWIVFTFWDDQSAVGNLPVAIIGIVSSGIFITFLLLPEVPDIISEFFAPHKERSEGR